MFRQIYDVYFSVWYYKGIFLSYTLSDRMKMKAIIKF